MKDSLGFWIPDTANSGFQVGGFQSLSVELHLVVISDSLSCIPNSKAQDIGFHNQNFPGLRNFQALVRIRNIAEWP